MAVTLPHTWRPFGTRVMGGIAGFFVVFLVGASWIGLGADRARFSPFQLLTLVFLGLIALGVWFALMRSKVVATEAALVVVNGYRKRTYEWAEVVGVQLRRGAPWATIDLSDGTTMSLIGIQGSDGKRAITAVRELRMLLSEHSGANPLD